MVAGRYAYVVEVAGAARASVFVRSDRIVIVLAEGAAAQTLIDTVGTASGADWCAMIETVQPPAAAVVVSVAPLGVTGASVGTVNAWIIGDEIADLTAGQGAFDAWPIGTSTLVVASAALLQHAQLQDIARIAMHADLGAAARGLVELVPMPIAVVVCRES